MPLFVEAEVDSVMAEVLVNGIPVQRFVPGGLTKHFQPINELVLPGDNLVRFEFRSEGGTPRHSFTPGNPLNAAAAAGLRIVLYADGETPGQDEGDEFMRGLWRQEDDPKEVPGGVEWHFELPDDYPRPAWADADVVADEDTTAPAAWHVVQTVHRLLTSGDAPRLMVAAAPMHATLARAYGEDPAAKAASELAWWTGFLPTLPPLAPLPPVPDDGLRLIAGGRLWEVLGEDWHPAIRGADGPDFAYPLCLGQVAGRWRILL